MRDSSAGKGSQTGKDRENAWRWPWQKSAAERDGAISGASLAVGQGSKPTGEQSYHRPCVGEKG